MSRLAYGELLRDATAKLAEFTDSPRLDAEILLGRATGKSRAQLFAWPEKTVDAAEMTCFESLLARRLAGEPIAHILGTREFWSREFRVTPDVLIPRPETELLVDLALQRIPPDRPARIADLGAGSGAIAVTLALELPKAQVLTLDLSPAALAVARDNAERLGARNLRFLASDWFAALDDDARFDLIVSNPPYIAENDPHLSRGDVRFEPALALSSGVDGLDAIRIIVADARKHLLPGAWLLFEHGYDQGASARELLHEAGYADVASYTDGLGYDRVSGGVLDG
ncbi:peptide chain release factor N(5)-glutamine methyltransferase [Methylococcus sp. EFPC2]|uniref:peptide chain release factor N(5)-glutamine methyltransferase n=1 Tax=Methylococcus sp. EFPC2 TaxID=2812648 RepID=UPI001967E92C|nr:peptide chain release factor N(5)-glutamine methyltransferase [Methylococcus sp. EFPC2]QSA96741.1 peptide chain release factor N(5)-glutamine methyltransferase [Methylococcus sp. EFPC2]